MGYDSVAWKGIDVDNAVDRAGPDGFYNFRGYTIHTPASGDWRMGGTGDFVNVERYNGASWDTEAVFTAGGFRLGTVDNDVARLGVNADGGYLNLGSDDGVRQFFFMTKDGRMYVRTGFGTGGVVAYNISRTGTGKEAESFAHGWKVAFATDETDEDFHSIIHTSDPGAWTAAADTDGADTYWRTQSGGAHAAADPRGGDLIVVPGAAGAGGAGRAGQFKVSGDAYVTGKLTVDGLIDPTGVEFVQQASNPGGVAANTIWINSADGHLYRGAVDVEAGGGGGTPGGADTQVQYNNAGAFGGSDGMTYDDTKKQLKLTPALTGANPPDRALWIELGSQPNTNTQASGILVTANITLNDEDTEIITAETILGGSVDAYGRDLDFIRMNIDTSGLGGGAAAHDSFFVRQGGQIAQSEVQSNGASLTESRHMHSIKSNGANIFNSTDVVNATLATDYRFVRGTTTNFGGGLAFASNATASHRAGIFWWRTGGGQNDGAIGLAAGNGDSDLVNLGVVVDGDTSLVRFPSAFQVRVQSTTASTNPTSGAAVVTGGLGVGGNGWFGGYIDVAGDVRQGAATYHYFGAPTTNGTWRIGRSGNNLVFERREAGVYVTKQTITP